MICSSETVEWLLFWSGMSLLKISPSSTKKHQGVQFDSTASQTPDYSFLRTKRNKAQRRRVCPAAFNKIAKEKSPKMRRIWMGFVVFSTLFTTKGTAGTNWTDCGATHCEKQILLLELDIHKNWIWAFCQLTLQLDPLPHSESSGSFHLSEASALKWDKSRPQCLQTGERWWNGEPHLVFVFLKAAGRALFYSKGQNDLRWNTCNSISKTLVPFLPFQSFSCKFYCRDEGIAPYGWGIIGSPEEFFQPRWAQ